MRHRKAGRRLGRNMSHRKATMQSLANALFQHNAIETGHLKAKELRRFAEPLITLSKVDTVANRRRAFAKLRDKDAVSKLFTTIGQPTRSAPVAIPASFAWVTVWAMRHPWRVSSWWRWASTAKKTKASLTARNVSREQRSGAAPVFLGLFQPRSPDSIDLEAFGRSVRSTEWPEGRLPGRVSSAWLLVGRMGGADRAFLVGFGHTSPRVLSSVFVGESGQ